MLNVPGSRPSVAADGRNAPPSPRPKRPRVSFATVSTRQFACGEEDPKKLSSPQEKQLSPLADASMTDDLPGFRSNAPRRVYNEEDATGEIEFPGISDLCASTPDASSGGRRNSMSADFSEMQSQMRKRAEAPHISQSSQGLAAFLPVGKDGSALSNPAVWESVGLLPSKSGSQQQQAAYFSARRDADDAEKSGEITASGPDFEALLQQDEGLQQAPPIRIPVQAPAIPSRTKGRMRSPEESTELPAQWDMFQEFRKNEVPQRRGTASDTRRRPTGGRSESPRRGSPDTVDMGAVVGAIEGRLLNSPENHDGGQLWEGRKSFSNIVPEHDGGATAAGRNSLVAGLPTPLRTASAAADVAETITNQVKSSLLDKEAKKSVLNEVKLAVSQVQRVMSQGSRPIQSSLRSSPSLRPAPSPRPSPLASALMEAGAARSFRSSHPLPTVPPLPGSGLCASPPSVVQQDLERLSAAYDEPKDSKFAAQRVHGTNRMSSSVFQDRRSTARSSRSYITDMGGFSESSLQYSPSQSLGELAGNSTLLQVNNHDASFHLETGPQLDSRIDWEQFLSHCSIVLPPIEPEAPAMDVDREVSRPVSECFPDECPRLQKAAAALGQKRAEILHKLVKDLSEANGATAQKYLAAVERWNQGATIPPWAAQLVQAHDAQPQVLEDFRKRIKSWQAFSKDEAWLKWYSLKRDWLRNELDVAQDHTNSLKAELSSMKEVGKRLAETSKKISREIRLHKQRNDTHGASKRFKEFVEEEFNTTTADRQLIEKQGAEKEEEMEVAQADLDLLERQIEEARSGAAQDDKQMEEVQHSLMQWKARRLLLEQTRLARTCMATKATASYMEVRLRAGAVVQIAHTGQLDLVKFSLVPERSDGLAAPGSKRVPRLGPLKVASNFSNELFALTWQTLIAELPAEQRESEKAYDGMMEVLVSSDQVPRMLRRLDCTAVRIKDQIDALRGLHRTCPEVLQVVARLKDGDEGQGPVLAVSATLALCRSHAVSAGPGGLTAIAGDLTEVDCAKCIIEFDADILSFPEENSIDWSKACVRQVVGAGFESQAVERALQCVRHVSLAEAMESVATAMSSSTR